MKHLLENGLLDRVLMTIFNSDGSVLDQLVIKCSFGASSIHEESVSQNVILAFEDEARSAILKMSMLDAILHIVSDGCTWQLMLVTKAEVDEQQSSILSNALKDGKWYTENSYLPESLRASTISSHDRMEAGMRDERIRKRNDRIEGAGTVAIKTIRTGLMNLEIHMEKQT